MLRGNLARRLLIKWKFIICINWAYESAQISLTEEPQHSQEIVIALGN